MVRRGARLKTIRRLGTPLPGLTRKEFERPADGRRPSRPRRARPRARSAYRRRLEEKQKVRFHYGVTERQLRHAFERARRRPGAAGELLLSMLERRLDNVVFRLGFAPTIPAARQLVSHGHVQVEGRRVNVPSQLVDPGQRISIAPRARTIPDVVASIENGPQVQLPSYLARDPSDPFTGHVIGEPRREDIPFIVDEAAIVEFYAR
jgi:small subunit ribosomal protein S4